MSSGKNCLSILSERDIEILAAYYYDDIPQNIIAVQYKISQARVCQIIKGATEKLVASGIPDPSKIKHGRMINFTLDQLDRLRETKTGFYSWAHDAHARRTRR